MSSPPGWLVARPVAHRGLHGPLSGAVENSLAAARAAVERGYAIECDVQVSADGEAMVFHDDALDRLTTRTGPVAGLPARDLAAVTLSGSDETIPTFASLLGAIAGRTPLVCEIKSRFDGDPRLADRVLALLADHAGPVALESFDPAVLLHLRARGCPQPVGLVTESAFDAPEWVYLTPATRRLMAQMLHFPDTRPDFLSFAAADLPHAIPLLFRAGLGRPVLAWTVRAIEEWRHAAPWADVPVFEGWLP